jgi:hypothetical protein
MLCGLREFRRPVGCSIQEEYPPPDRSKVTHTPFFLSGIPCSAFFFVAILVGFYSFFLSQETHSHPCFRGRSPPIHCPPLVHSLLFSLRLIPIFFQAFANAELKCSGIYSPRVNESIVLEADTQIHQIQIRNDLWDSLRFIHTSPYDIAYIRGVVTARKRKAESHSDQRMAIDSDKGEKEEEGVGQGEGEVPVLMPIKTSRHNGEEEEEDSSQWEPDPVTLHHLKRRKTHHAPLYIGDVGLKDLRKAAEDEGVSATLQSGVLTCGADVRIRKLADNTEERSRQRWEVDGHVSDLYYKLRQLLLQRYQAV